MSIQRWHSKARWASSQRARWASSQGAKSVGKLSGGKSASKGKTLSARQPVKKGKKADQKVVQGQNKAEQVKVKSKKLLSALQERKRMAVEDDSWLQLYHAMTLSGEKKKEENKWMRKQKYKTILAIQKKKEEQKEERKRKKQARLKQEEGDMNKYFEHLLADDRVGPVPMPAHVQRKINRNK